MTIAEAALLFTLVTASAGGAPPAPSAPLDGPPAAAQAHPSVVVAHGGRRGGEPLRLRRGRQEGQLGRLSALELRRPERELVIDPRRWTVWPLVGAERVGDGTSAPYAGILLRGRF